MGGRGFRGCAFCGGKCDYDGGMRFCSEECSVKSEGRAKEIAAAEVLAAHMAQVCRCGHTRAIHRTPIIGGCFGCACFGFELPRPPELADRKLTLDELLLELGDLVMNASPEELASVKVRYAALHARAREAAHVTRSMGATCHMQPRTAELDDARARLMSVVEKRAWMLTFGHATRFPSAPLPGAAGVLDAIAKAWR